MDINLDRLVNMAASCEEVVGQRFGELSKLGVELDALDGRTCNGWEYWRDKNHPTRAPKLYVLHAVSQACPLHGEPEPGGRLLVYVGSDPEDVARARAAMEWEIRRRRLRRRLAKIRRGLASCDYYLQGFYDQLDYGVQSDGRPKSR
jgi:hypothetical protein